jgi:hypothetical protein
VLEPISRHRTGRESQSDGKHDPDRSHADGDAQIGAQHQRWIDPVNIPK